ncbi:MAG: TRAP transporter large permease subunit [Treponema sp.]|nr:TRAP transporter large permease subunit [Treponema sp.]
MRFFKEKLVPAFAKIENTVAVIFTLLLTIIPLLVKIFQWIKIPIINADNAQVNIVMMFACIAGMITWREGRHISLATLTDNLTGLPKKIIHTVRASAVTSILCAMFFYSFSQLTVFYAGEKIWGVPLKAVFAFLPFAYMVMLIRSVIKSEHKIASVLGLILGIAISAGPISGILYSLFNLDIPFLYDTWNNAWVNFSSVAFVPLVILLIVLAFMGVPLFVVISAIAFVCLSQCWENVDVLAEQSYSILTDKSIGAIPLFTIAGYIFSQGSAGKRLVEVFKALFGWFRGGTVIATVVVCTIFTTFTGVTGVTILALGSLLTVALSGSGLKKDDSESLITASGALGILFPPSVAIIMYASSNYFSVDVFDLFKGALIPGIILASSMIIMGFIKDKNPDRPKFSFKAIFSALKYGAFELAMPILIMAGYFSGFFTLMEAAAFAVIYSFIIETFIRKDFTFKQALKIISDSIPITGGVLMILAAAKGLSYYFVIASVPQILTDFIAAHITNKYLFLLLMNLFLLLVGCFMDVFSAILIVSPLLIPIAATFGINQVHLGVMFLMNLQLGFLTPPVGMDLFIASYTFEKPVMKVVKGILPYLLIQFIVLLLITYVPIFSTFLVPNAL